MGGPSFESWDQLQQGDCYLQSCQDVVQVLGISTETLTRRLQHSIELGARREEASQVFIFS
jgi:hypothetical protein